MKITVLYYFWEIFALGFATCAVGVVVIWAMADWWWWRKMDVEISWRKKRDPDDSPSWVRETVERMGSQEKEDEPPGS